MMFLSLAFVFAGNRVFGQAIPLNQGITSTQPIPALTCADGTDPLPLHPYPGVPYIYTMDGTTGVENAQNWTWFATKDPNFIVDGDLTLNRLDVASGALLDVSANYGIEGTSNSVTITWSAEILAATKYQGDATGWATANSTNPSPTFVVGFATGEKCADNIQVYEINPQFNFTLDIANIDPETDGTLNWGTVTEQCVDDVWKAIYNNTSKELDMDYGSNELYFEVAAANFVNDFTPTFYLISGLVADQTAVVTLHSSLADAQADANVHATKNWTAASLSVDGSNGWNADKQFTAANSANVVGGVSLFVKVVITNNTYESLTVNPFTLAVDAQDDNETGIWDMEEDDCTPATAEDAADWADQATHNIQPRPTIIMDGGAMSEPTAPDPDDLIEKTDGSVTP